jgi:radical SAM family uncharacterized protein
MRYASVRAAIDPILPAVERPGRYLGLERNAIRKDLRSAKISLALAFPETYEIGMSHTGLRVLYEIVNRDPRFACERAYAPWIDMEREMRARRIPLFTVESFAPVRDFDVLGISLQAELNYSNIPNLLDLAGIPVWQKDRGDGNPLVLGGGPCTANPEPIAPFFDAFLLGDGEDALPKILETVVRHPLLVPGPDDRGTPHGSANGHLRRELLAALAAIEGVYVPSFYDVLYNSDGTIAGFSRNEPKAPEHPRRTWIPALRAGDYPERPLVPSVDIVQDRLGLEIMRGCTQGCRFCQAGYWYRPVRELDPGDVEAMTKRFVSESGWSEVGLLSLSTADYSQIEPLVSCLAPQLASSRVSISLPSLRAEAFSVGLADAVSEVRKSGFTFAPETGSDRLRRVINKTFTNADMVAAADVAFARGWDLIKIYTMVGLPTETDEDLDELVRLVRDILAVGKKHGRKEVNVSVGPFVPKAWTPFQWAAFDGVETLSRKIDYLKRKFRGIRGARYKGATPEEAEIECLLSRGDRRVASVIFEAWKNGVKFDGWSECFRPDLWRQAFAAAGIDPGFYLREHGLEQTLPWDLLDVSITKRFLQIELIKARNEWETADCKWGRCYACGVPGNGEDTVLARPMAGSASPLLPTHETPLVPDGSGRPVALKEKARAAAYRVKAMPDLPVSPRARPGFRNGPPVAPMRWRFTFEKRGDARFLSHRNTMDVFDRAIRAAGLPARYSEGYNPHMKMSMGPALPLGLESRHEVFDLETLSRLLPETVEEVNARLPTGLRVLEIRKLEASDAALSRAVRSARYAVRLDSELTARAGPLTAELPAGIPALRQLWLDAPEATLRFEINLDASAGETSTPKKVLEALLRVPAEAQRGLSIVREETVLH